MAGKYLVHWRYTTEEWRAFLAGQAARTDQSARLMPIWFVLGGVSALLLIGVSPTALVVGAVGLAAAGWVIGRALVRHAGSASFARRPESFITRDAVSVAGRTTRIAGGGTRVQAMRLLEGRPRVLELSLRHGSAMERAYSVVRLPVPLGREDEAEEVLRAFGYSPQPQE